MPGDLKEAIMMNLDGTRQVNRKEKERLEAP
jgi:hypothetical protein